MNERGSLLITALWAVSIFSIMTASLTFHAGEEILMIKRELAAFKDRTDFVSGLSEAARQIQEDPDPHEDSQNKPWFGEVKMEGPLGERLSVRLEDEESKANLNDASEAFLSTFFKMFEEETTPLRGERKDYVKAIAKLRSEKRIGSLEELLLTEDFKREDFQALRPYLTVYPESPLINLNTAGALILQTLVQSLQGDHGAKQIFWGRLQEACKNGCFFLSRELEPEIFREKLKLPETPLMMQLVQEFVVSVTTDSETFRMVMKSKTGREASAVFRFRVGQMRPEVFWWHEEV